MKEFHVPSWRSPPLRSHLDFSQTGQRASPPLMLFPHWPFSPPVRRWSHSLTWWALWWRWGRMSGLTAAHPGAWLQGLACRRSGLLSPAAQHHGFHMSSLPPFLSFSPPSSLALLPPSSTPPLSDLPSLFLHTLSSVVSLASHFLLSPSVFHGSVGQAHRTPPFLWASP